MNFKVKYFSWSAQWSADLTLPADWFRLSLKVQVFTPHYPSVHGVQRPAGSPGNRLHGNVHISNEGTLTQ